MPLLVKCSFILLFQFFWVSGQWSPESDDFKGTWSGNWFPHTPGQAQDTNQVGEIRVDLYDAGHFEQMGHVDPHCDDAENNLEIDWDFNPMNYTCFNFNKMLVFKARSDVKALYSHDFIPSSYKAMHNCMNRSIEYTNKIPTFGTHRPLWAQYGEYTFLPKQRWLHNLEHGAVVMLYHPCADKNEVEILKMLVRKCLYRHIITPYNLLSPKRPLALITWGHRLEISKVDPEMVIEFIKGKALKGPERTARDGQYSLMLERHAEILNEDIQDTEICKTYI